MTKQERIQQLKHSILIYKDNHTPNNTIDLHYKWYREDVLDEINTIDAMSDEEWAKFTNNLEN